MTRHKNQIAPLARNEGLVVKQLEDELLLYDLERGKAHCLNSTAALVWRECDGVRNVSEIAARMGRELGARPDEEVVRLALRQLSTAKLLTESVATPNVLSRRQLLRRGAAAAAVTLPLITSLAAPVAAQASSCASFACVAPILECNTHPNCSCVDLGGVLECRPIA